MKSWVIILLGMVASWRYMDVTSESGFEGVFLRILFFLFLISAVIKIALKQSGKSGSGSGLDGVGDGGFGDGGGCD